MRIHQLLLVALFATFTATIARATPLPVGTYYLSATTPLSGIHSGSDIGNLTGTLTFDAASNITFANLAFDDLTSGKVFTFTIPGPITITPHPPLLGATITNAINPSELYTFSIRTPSNPDGSFTLTCGTDCDNWMLVDDGLTNLTYVEVQGSIDPVPEPSALTLVGIGALTALGSLRRRILHS